MIDIRPEVERFSNEALEAALRDLLGTELTLISRAPAFYESTHHIEDVAASVDDQLFELVCKYSAPWVDPVSDHRRGVAYESQIYERAFPDDRLITPICHGLFSLDGSVDCLVLEHIDGAALSSGEARGLVEVSGELGRFHSGGVGSLPSEHNIFNRSYFARLMSEMERFPGVTSRLDRSGSTVVDILANAPRALIHGALRPADVLVDAEGPVVIDWETAGVGPGVFDFARLTVRGWDDELVEECEDAYWRGRGDANPAWGRRNLAAARAMAAGMMLLDMRGEQFDPDTEAMALETLGAQASHIRT